MLVGGKYSLNVAIFFDDGYAYSEYIIFEWPESRRRRLGSPSLAGRELEGGLERSLDSTSTSVNSISPSPPPPLIKLHMRVSYRLDLRTCFRKIH
jgi:hypothetical protein